jgi:uncharacterized peroxidase-related enzyme
MTTVVEQFTTKIPYWNPYIVPVDLETASQEQKEALKITPSNMKVSEYVLVLAHDPETLAVRSPLFNEVMYGKDGLGRAERELAALGASIYNGCVYCTAVHSSRYISLSKRPEVVDEIFASGVDAELDENASALFDLSVKLSKAPPEVPESSIGDLRAMGYSDLEIFDLILSAAMFGWANRLMHSLGEPLMSKP